jgi:ABC-type lipoprotein export system ATPase subunit
MGAKKTDTTRQLEAVLDAFGGDVEALEQALRELKATQRREEAPVADRSEAAVVVSLTDVNRRYKLGREIVGAVTAANLEIRQGEFVAITGPSGSGKSTLLNLIGGLDKPDSGTAIIGGRDLAKLSDRQLSRFRNTTVGFVFQFFYLQPFLDVRANLTVPGMFSRLPKADRAVRIAELADAVGLTDRLNHLPKELSGGQMQRAAIARALLNRPKLILADEPTGNVDRANARSIIELFAKVRDTYDTTVIIVTHDPEVAAQADRTITLRDGRII